MEVTILEKIKNGDKEAIASLYADGTYEWVRKFILLNGGNEEDAKDVFMDSIVAFYNSLQKEGFTLSSSIKTYLYAISRNIWLKKLRSKSRNTRIENLPEDKVEQLKIADEEARYFELEELKNRNKLLEESLNELGEPCKGILVDIFFNDLSYEEIASKYEYADEHQVRKKKFLCVDKLRKIVRKNAELKNS